MSLEKKLDMALTAIVDLQRQLNELVDENIAQAHAIKVLRIAVREPVVNKDGVYRFIMVRQAAHFADLADQASDPSICDRLRRVAGMMLDFAADPEPAQKSTVVAGGLN